MIVCAGNATRSWVRSAVVCAATIPGTTRITASNLVITLVPSLPCRVDRFPNQVGRIRAGTRTEFLESSRVNLGDIEIAFLIGAHAVHTPERAREIRDRSPRVQETTIEIVLEHLVRVPIEGHDGAVIADLDK